jgi:TM2 domain-containing membrane protein YozV
MKTRLLLCGIFLVCCLGRANAQHGHQELRFLKDLGKEVIKGIVPERPSFVEESTSVEENPRAVAAALTILAGPFGAHRIYLGTTEWVPVFYTLTLGGGLGVLPIIDLVYILVKNDISGCYHNPHIFMWAHKKAGP